MNHCISRPTHLALLVLMVLTAVLPTWSIQAEEKIDLSLKLTPGDSYSLELLIDQDIDQHIPLMNQQMKMDQVIGMTMRYEVTDRPPSAGGVWVKMTYDGVKFMMNGPMGKTDYDSANPPANVPVAARGMAAMLGESLQFEQLPDGKVAAIEGVQQLQTKMIDALDMPEGPVKESMKGMMEGMFNEEMIKQMVAASAGMYPGKPVARSDSWNDTQNIGGMMPMQIDVDYTLNDFDGDTASLDVAGEIGPNPDAEIIVMNGMEMDAEFNGEQTGTIVVDRETGYIISSDITQNMDGGMTVNLPNGNSMDIEMKITGKITMKRVDPAE